MPKMNLPTQNQFFSFNYRRFSLIHIIIISLICIFVFCPFLIFGQNSIITFLDQLEIVSFYKVGRDNSLLFKFDVPFPALGNISTLYLFNYSFTTTIFAFFDAFSSLILLNYIGIIIGFFSMFFLLRKLIRDSDVLITYISIIFALTPAVFDQSIPVKIIPLLVLLFIYLSKRNKFTFLTFLTLFYPFFSSLIFIGYFLIFLWLIATIYFVLKNKKININLVLGLLFLVAGYVLTEIRLFYVMFFLKVPTSRSVYVSPETGLSGSGLISFFKNFWKGIYNYLIIGGYLHTNSMNKIVILPVSLMALAEITYLKYKKQEINNKGELLFRLILLSIAIVLIASLYNTQLINFGGFNWGRVWIFNVFLWYVVFSLCLYIFIKTKFTFFNESAESEVSMIVEISKNLKNWVTLFLIIVQLCNVLTRHTYQDWGNDQERFFNDQYFTWMNELFVKSGIINSRDFVSYRDFFSEEYFQYIKSDIEYHGEKVAAFGFVPSVLLYNGFYTIDGNHNIIPLSYFNKFERLIMPALDKSLFIANYFRTGMGRLYLYIGNSIIIPPTKMRTYIIDTGLRLGTDLNIDIDIFINEFNGKYIFSIYQIDNANELNLKLRKIYYSESSIYTIFLYETN